LPDAQGVCVSRWLDSNYTPGPYGLDEVGTGALAGPIVVAGVVLSPAAVEVLTQHGLDDSKRLSPAKRDRLHDLVWNVADVVDITSIPVVTLDRATNQAAALDDAFRALIDGAGDLVAVIDGNHRSGLGRRHVAVVKGDQKVAAIAAASIIAKVTRDHMLVGLGEVYPDYGFAQHKGYPTKQHKEALEKYGACPAHRTIQATLRYRR
jgi:ribonuclease HII